MLHALGFHEHARFVNGAFKLLSQLFRVCNETWTPPKSGLVQITVKKRVSYNLGGQRDAAEDAGPPGQPGLRPDEA
jgi:hypothetical protein